MARIVGVNISDNKRVDIALTRIRGIGRVLSRKILLEAGIDLEKKAGDLLPQEIAKLKEIIGKRATVEGELRRQITMNIKRLRDIHSWRGSRHAKGLPVRGQTTRINSRTVRGNVRKTMGSGRAKAPTAK